MLWVLRSVDIPNAHLLSLTPRSLTLPFVGVVQAMNACTGAAAVRHGNDLEVPPKLSTVELVHEDVDRPRQAQEASLEIQKQK